MIRNYQSWQHPVVLFWGLLVIISVSEIFAQINTIPFGMSPTEWQLRQIQYNAGEIAAAPSGEMLSGAIINGGFETGDLSGWTVSDLAIPWVPLQSALANYQAGFGLFGSEPSEGRFAAVNGFGGGGPGTISLSQLVTLPTNSLSLRFDYRAGWDLISFCNGCTGTNIFRVLIETLGGGNAIIDTVLLAQPGTQNFDTGSQLHFINVTGLAGMQVRIAFEWIIAEFFTGPAFFQLDDVYLTQSGPQVKLSPNPANFGNVGRGFSDTLGAQIRNAGSQDLTINSISSPGGAFSLNNLPSLPALIHPGESAVFNLQFTAQDTGLFSGDFTLSSNDPDDPSLTVPILARGVPVNHQVELLANVNDHFSLGYSDCWGYTAPNGDEYALLGVNGGVSIVQTSDPLSISEIEFVPFVTAWYPGWYDIKVYQQYMYVSSEFSLEVQIVDLSNLPGPVSIVGMMSGLTSPPHNLFVDSEAGLLYAVEDFNPISVRIFSLANPANPVPVGTIDPSNNGSDAHDVFAQDSMLYIAEGSSPTIGIFDVSNPANPVLITRHPIPSAGYVHNVWVSEDNQIMVTTEETPGHTVKIWDIVDLNNISLLGEYLGENHLAHNAYLKSDMLIIAHYQSGLKVVDISDPANPSEYGFYDTYIPGDNPDFNGAWGAYPFTQNGMMYVSDMQTGLYVVRITGPVGIENEKPLLATTTILEPNYPNPFNPNTTIGFQLAQHGQVELAIFDVLGRRVRTLVNREFAPGSHTIQWDGRDDSGNLVNSGVYFYRLKTSDFSQTRKMFLMK